MKHHPIRGQCCSIKVHGRQLMIQHTAELLRELRVHFIAARNEIPS